MYRLAIILGLAHTVTLERSDVKTLIKDAAFFSELPSQCPLCQSTVHFTHRTAQEFDYYGLRCTGNTPHETTFGEYKDSTRGFFYKSGSWAAAFAGQGSDGTTQAPTSNVTPGPGPITDNQQRLIRDRSTDPEGLARQAFGVSLIDLTKGQASMLIDHLLTGSRLPTSEGPTPTPPSTNPAMPAPAPVDDDIPF